MEKKVSKLSVYYAVLRILMQNMIEKLVFLACLVFLLYLCKVFDEDEAFYEHSP